MSCQSSAKAEILSRIKTGELSVSRAARLYRIDSKVIRGWCRLSGIKPRGNSDEFVGQVVTVVADGKMSVPQAAVRFGVDERTIWLWCKRRGVRLVAERKSERARSFRDVGLDPDHSARQRMTDAAHSLYWPMESELGAHVCVYCGERAWSVDHMIPLSHVAAVHAVGMALPANLWIVPACEECNSLAADYVFQTFEERRDHVRASMRRKYASFIRMPEWSSWEISQLAGSTKIDVRNSNKGRERLMRRLDFETRLIPS